MRGDVSRKILVCRLTRTKAQKHSVLQRIPPVDVSIFYAAKTHNLKVSNQNDKTSFLAFPQSGCVVLLEYQN